MLFQKILSIFAIMALGFAAMRLKAVDKAFIKSLSAFMMNIALPVAFIASLDRSIPKSVLPELGVMLLWSIGAHAASIAVSSALWRRFPEAKRKVLTFGTVFTNSAFMGMPVAQSLAGPKGLMFAMVYNVVYVTMIYTYGMSLFREGDERIRWGRVLVNPGTVSVLIGFVVWFLPWDLPVFLSDAIGMMAKLQTPLAMFVVGANIAGIRAAGLLKSAALPFFVVLRLAALPLAAVGLIRLSGAAGTAPAIAALMVAMPAGAQTVVVAEQKGGDSVFASEIVFATTVLSLASIPLIAGLVL